MANTLLAVLLVVIATGLGAYAALFFKRGSTIIGKNILTFLTNKYLYLGGFLYIVSTVFFVPALRYGDLSFVYPLTSLTYIWVSLLSVKYFGEKMTSWKIAGICFILFGIILIGSGL